MARTRYAVIVAALAAATVAGGINAEAAPAQPAQPNRMHVHAPARAAAAVAANPGTQFTAVAPVRVLDTRVGTGATGPVGPGATINVDMSAAIPADAEAAVLNVTGTDVTAATFVTVFPNEAARPLASNLNLVPGQTRPNAVTVALGPSRIVSLFNNSGSTQLIADLAGYYIPTTGSKFTTVAPTRVLDTRFGTGTGGSTAPVPSGGTITVDLANQVPATATAVTFNLTGTEGTANTFITAFPAGAARPLASSLNLVPGETAPNLVTVKLSADRKVSLFNNFGNTHLVADLAGFYDPNQGDVFFPILPERLFDSRVDLNPPGPLDAAFPLELIFDGFPPSVSGFVGNLTGTEPSAAMFVTAWPQGSPRPLASNLNLVAGQTVPNMITTKVGPSSDGTGQFSINFQNNVGTYHFILDLSGAFAPPIP